MHKADKRNMATFIIEKFAKEFNYYTFMLKKKIIWRETRQEELTIEVQFKEIDF